MNTLMILLLLLIADFRTVRPGAIEVADDTRNYDESRLTEDETVEEKMKELRIEMVKLQILSKLNLKEPLPSVPPPSELSRETIRLLLAETEDHQQHTQPQDDIFNKEEHLIIHPKSGKWSFTQKNLVWFGNWNARKFL